MKAAGFDFEVRTVPTDENFPLKMEPAQVAVYIAQKKATSLSQFWSSHLVLAADTIVVLNGQILGKPAGASDAIRMLTQLSGQEHEVVTGVAICADYHCESLADTTKVWFRQLDPEEIEYYVKNYNPMDKAGAYGIQEWLGMIGITKIEGSYFNVVGLPIHLVYEKLKTF